ncbi:MAG: hypothetical protein ACI8PB_004664 [Desulforhopalus sp.]|jgi:hypothetical protein
MLWRSLSFIVLRLIGGHATKRGLSKELDCILVACARSGHTLDFITGRGSTSKTQLEPHLKFTLHHDALLVSDGHRGYKAFCDIKRITYESIILSKGQRIIIFKM